MTTCHTDLYTPPAAPGDGAVTLTVNASAADLSPILPVTPRGPAAVVCRLAARGAFELHLGRATRNRTGVESSHRTALSLGLSM